QSINQCKITKNLSQNVVHSDSDLILHNSSVLIDKEPYKKPELPFEGCSGFISIITDYSRLFYKS
ncbi:hypothetical protein QQ371_14405, partial [Enterococcus faecium]|nr:hypothetical protein [Enterococcus faecium]